MVTPNARKFEKKTRTDENTGAPWANVFISRIIHARDHVKKTAKKLPEVFLKLNQSYFPVRSYLVLQYGF
jgi:hypothetical protein